MENLVLMSSSNFENGINWLVLIPFGIIAIALLTYIIIRNQKDETKFEKEVKKEDHLAAEQEENEDDEL